MSWMDGPKVRRKGPPVEPRCLRGDVGLERDLALRGGAMFMVNDVWYIYTFFSKNLTEMCFQVKVVLPASGTDKNAEAAFAFHDPQSKDWCLRDGLQVIPLGILNKLFPWPPHCPTTVDLLNKREQYNMFWKQVFPLLHIYAHKTCTC